MKVYFAIFASFCCVVVFLVQGLTALGGCSDDSICTDLCGYAGTGKCVNGTHCVCETCPQRSTAELSLAYAVKICTPEPFCQLKCPKSSFSLTTGKLYSGHICSSLTNPLDITCICFCMPTTLASLGTILRCPVVPNFTEVLG
ncbi:uncharacterized protein LOC110852580 [Folsomia candida]|uniref:Uncharacterized protein n=1 Tax=Folsomia candida TaxID=158441 RepID=A0A226E620_FOLCA|nr:uncharacterized protein LOC110852580 [Folsomia candida]OXA52341.1 hypothetical protein Fcan01_12972 [Folsomia candida]